MPEDDARFAKVTRTALKLQWGRRPMTARKLGWREVEARGKSKSFNGAAVRGRRKESARLGTALARKAAWLQWGRRPRTTESTRGASAVKRTSKHDASMGPPSDDDGKRRPCVGASNRKFPALQWGRLRGRRKVPSSTSSSRRWRRFGLQWGRRPRTTETREEGDGRCHRRCSLQWGRRPRTTEKTIGRRSWWPKSGFNGAAVR